MDKNKLVAACYLRLMTAFNTIFIEECAKENIVEVMLATDHELVLTDIAAKFAASILKNLIEEGNLNPESAEEVCKHFCQYVIKLCDKAELILPH